MELRRQRGVATFVTFPFKDASGTMITGITGISPQYATWTDGTAPNTKFSTISGGVVEINASGRYYSSLTATEMANDYIYFYASPTSGSARPIDLLINCTAVASVTVVASVSNPVPLLWSSITGTSASQVLSGTVIASVNYPVALNWASISGTNTGQTLSGTTFATVDGVTSSVSPDWGRLIRPTSTNNLTGTRVASVNNPVPLLWSSITSPGAVVDLSGTSFATVSWATVGGVGTVTGVTNTVQSNLVQWLTVPPNVLTGGRVDSYAAVLNWASVTAPGTTVDLTNTTIASVNNVATVNFVASVSAAVLSNVGTVTGVTNSVNANVTTITGVTNSVSVSTVQGVTNTVFATLTKAVRAMMADDWLARSIAGGSDGGRTNQDAMRLLRNRRALTFGAMNTATLTAFQENDSTPAWTAIVSTGSAVGLTDVDAS